MVPLEAPTCDLERKRKQEERELRRPKECKLTELRLTSGLTGRMESKYVMIPENWKKVRCVEKLR